MPLFDTVTLSAAYFPPVEYFFAIAQSGRVVVEQNELYQKQSYRNRCRIYSGGGVMQLSIPVIKDVVHARPIRDIRIDYSEPWLQQHTRAIEAAYNSSPFYLYYKDDFLEILRKKPEFLFDLDVALTEKLLELVGIRAKIEFTDSFRPDCGTGDLRARIQPKYRGESLLDEFGFNREYYQIFSSRFGFRPNLSILDLLCHEGPGTISFLI